MEIPVIVEYVRYRNDNGFAILSCSLNAYSSKYSPELEEVLKANVKETKYNNFTVTIGMLDVDEKVENRQYIFSGEFFKHHKFGDQFKADFYFADAPVTESGLKAYLMDFPHIKEARSEDIIRKFGVEGTIDILENDIDKLLVINGITEPRLPAIKEQWNKDKSKRELYFWLSDHGIQTSDSKKIYEKWKDKSQEVLAENPYKLTEIRGFGFEKADAMAYKILDEIPKEYRAKHVCNMF